MTRASSFTLSRNAVPLTFSLNGEKVELLPGTWDLSTSLNDYLRSKPSLRATKVACGEGGCGACAVVLSKAADLDNEETTCIAINSCLRPLASLHGWNVTTAEGLGSVCCKGKGRLS